VDIIIISLNDIAKNCSFTHWYRDDTI